MAYKVRWSPEAADDLENIAEFISRDSDNYARILVNKILQSTRNLPLFPYSGRMVPEFEEESIREVFIYN